MEISGQVDIEAPQQFVFRCATDFPAFERQAMRRGADVRRRDSLAAPQKGMAWDIRFQFRGKDRELGAELIAFDKPKSMIIALVSGGLTGKTTVELVALTPNRTRLITRTDLSAESLAGRLFLQSLKLARGQFTSRLNARLATFGQDVEKRWAKRS
jgi:hypothetical protein